jgi:hypothetical protein
MKARISIVLFSLVFLHFAGVCQQQTNDCNEQPGSPTKVFVFVGELLNLKQVPAEDDFNETRFVATYRIIEKVCGSFPRDTIRFHVIQMNYDTSFAKIRNQLLMLIKDTADNDYKLWGDLSFDVFKTTNNQWAVPYMEKNETVTIGQKALKERKMRFAKDAFYDTKGMTKEEVGIVYYEPYYRIEKDRVVPLMGNTIEEVFRYEKEGTLASAGAYERPADRHPITIREVEMADIKEEDPDSVKQVLEKELLAIKDSLAIDPFNEKQIRALIRNCGAKEDYSYCKAYFENLLNDYPDSIRAYLVKAKLRHPKANLEDTSRIFVLLQAVKVDSDNYEANYELAISYYRLFHRQPGNHFAYAARKSFIRCAVIDPTELIILKYPVIQLSNFLNDSSTANFYKYISTRDNSDTVRIPTVGKHNWYFPVGLFLRKKIDWQSDYSVDIMHELDMATFQIDWLSDALKWFKEPVLTSKHPQEVYRLLWSRSFDPPVVIRLEKTNNDVFIYWKLPASRDALDIAQSALQFKKKLSLRDWKKFEQSLNDIDYWSMLPSEYKHKSTDGAMWVLEGAVEEKYQITIRPGDVYPKYTDCLKSLIRLTDLNIPKNRTY